ncbi:hypothetical protein C2G38_2154991 [Gigaspora rosea]|uniref:Uncharacterized protein n=1 Tax=Gigaspora rosea TaxID=44941 RepID=A0A397WAJ5_9GLOM|nr:hypothetical protein C2G38_2154991 [Gigaspora rosea]
MFKSHHISNTLSVILKLVLIKISSAIPINLYAEIEHKLLREQARDWALSHGLYREQERIYWALSNALILRANFNLSSTTVHAPNSLFQLPFPKKDFEFALECIDVDLINVYQNFADIGNPIAIYNLACCYQNGIGVEKDENKAFIYCQG